MTTEVSAGAAARRHPGVYDTLNDAVVPDADWSAPHGRERTGGGRFAAVRR